MQKCVDCAHHDACKQWADHLKKVVDVFNVVSHLFLGDKSTPVSNIDFPLVQSPEFDNICENYETVQP